MNRLEKELRNRGIIFEADEFDITKGAEYDECTHLVTITDTVLVVAYYSGVIDPMFRLYDRKTLEFICSQDMYRDDQPFFGGKSFNPWMVSFPFDPEELTTSEEDDYPNDAEDADMLDAMFEYYHGHTPSPYDDDRY